MNSKSVDYSKSHAIFDRLSPAYDSSPSHALKTGFRRSPTYTPFWSGLPPIGYHLLLTNHNYDKYYILKNAHYFLFTLETGRNRKNVKTGFTFYSIKNNY